MRWIDVSGGRPTCGGEDLPIRALDGTRADSTPPRFGDASGYGKIGGEYFSLGAGTDISRLLQGLDGDLCQSPHWGYVIEGKLTVTFTGGEEEVVSSSDLFYWDNKWVSLGQKTAGHEPVIFDNLPAGRLYWMIAEQGKKTSGKEKTARKTVNDRIYEMIDNDWTLPMDEIRKSLKYKKNGPSRRSASLNPDNLAPKRS